MLTQLQISGLAIIESLCINFSSGFNVITGETGAGKSILIKALSFLLGGKTTSEIIRHGFSQASVSGTFEVHKRHKSIEILNELGVPLQIDDPLTTVIVRRSVFASNNKSMAWVNDIPITMQSLKLLGYYLIDIFGQHENQKLLNPNEHINILDKFIFNQCNITETEMSFLHCSSIIKEIQAISQDFKSKKRDRDYLLFRLEELKKLNPSQEEFQSLSQLCNLAMKKTFLREKISFASTILDQGGLDHSPLSSTFIRLKNIISELSTHFSQLRESTLVIENIAHQIDEISFQVEKLQSSLLIDEQDYESAQEQLSKYQNFCRKFSVNTVEQLIDEQNKLQEELNLIENFSEKIAELVCKLYAHSCKLHDHSSSLSKERETIAKKVSKKVEKELQELGMKGARFEVEFSPILRNMTELLPIDLLPKDSKELSRSLEILSQTTQSGREKAQFLLAPNLGEQFKPLTRIASGGEISRIMLAIKKALSAGAETCVLVFDEIDSGISGRIADVVGQKMKELSSKFQVICISHLPQVAVYANQHFLVEKFQRKNRTESRIIPLSETETANEIARLLSGTEVTEMSLSNAKNLVKLAKASCNQ